MAASARHKKYAGRGILVARYMIYINELYKYNIKKRLASKCFPSMITCLLDPACNPQKSSPLDMVPAEISWILHYLASAVVIYQIKILNESIVHTTQP